MVHVIATIEVADGRRDDLLKIFRGIVPAVRAEDGCIEYGATIDATTNIEAQTPAGENAMIVVEKWRDSEALSAHLAAPHMDAFRKDVEGIVENLTIQILEPIG